MLKLRSDKPLRVACGMGLLLLLAAHEKVCPWLRTVPREADPDGVPPASPATSEEAPTKRAPKRLPHLLPEVAAPRWPAGWTAGTWRPTGGRDGLHGQDPRPDDADSWLLVAATGPELGWWRNLAPLAPSAELIVTGALDDPPADPAVRTCIHPAGPPRGATARTVGAVAPASA